MATKRKKRKKVSARDVANRAGSFESTNISIPDGVEMFKVDKAGSYRLDIIPYEAGEGNPEAEPGDLHFERTFFIHRDIGANQDAYICPAKTSGEPCPICEYRNKLDKDPDSDPDAIKALLPKKRQLWNVFDHDEPDKGVQLWEVSYHLFGKDLYDRIKHSDEEDGYEFFADPDDGMTIKAAFEKKSLGGNTFYDVVSIDFKPRKRPLDDDLLDAAICLDDLPIIREYDDLKAIFLQQDDSDEDDAPKKSRGKGKAKGKGRRKARKPEPEEDEDEPPFDDDDDDDDEDDEPPKRKRKAKGKGKRGPKNEPHADEFGLEVGMEVTHDGEDCTIVKISKDGTSLTLEDDDGDHVRGVGPEEVTIVESDDEPDDEPDADDEDDEDDEPEPPKRKKRGTKKATKGKAKGKRKKPEPEPEPEADDDDDDDDDDDWDDWDDD